MPDRGQDQQPGRNPEEEPLEKPGQEQQPPRWDPEAFHQERRRRRLRAALFFAAALPLAFLFLRGMSGLTFQRYPGPYGDWVREHVETQRHTPEAVGAITLDYRGFDTLGEEFIFFTAVMAITLLMRKQRGEEHGKPKDGATGRRRPPTEDAVAVLGSTLFAVTLLFSLYVILHGHLSPGGGFQGGALLGTAFLYVYLSSEELQLERLVPSRVLHPIEAGAAAGYVSIGLLAVMAGAAFLQNLLPLGKTGEIPSAGTLPILNGVIGIEVGAGFLLILWEFLKQTLEVEG